jgi:hypothetical protein
MKTWHFYESSTGEPTHRSYAGPAEHLDANTPDGCEARADAPEPPPVQEELRVTPGAIALARIQILEAKQPRVLRELALGDADAKARLQALDDEISALRSQLVAATDTPSDRPNKGSAAS